LERIVICQFWIASDKDLLNPRLTGLRGFAKSPIVGRNIAPAQKGLPLLGNNLFKLRLAQLPLLLVRRKKYEPTTVLFLIRQPDLCFVRNLSKKHVRHLHENTCPVTGIIFAAACASMAQID